MINFTLENSNAGIFIESCELPLLRINGREYRQSLWLTPNSLSHWSPTSIDELNETTLEPMLTTAADVILIGTGEQQRFLSMHQLAPFYRKGIGVEVMNSCAACRTFNILTSDGRRPVAGIIVDV